MKALIGGLVWGIISVFVHNISIALILLAIVLPYAFRFTDQLQKVTKNDTFKE